MTREEFEYQKQYGMAKIYKWGTYKDARVEEAMKAQQEAMEQAEAERLAAEQAAAGAAESPAVAEPASEPAPPEEKHYMSFPMTANVDEVDESQLSEAELFARELEKKQASRIQDDVLGMVAALQAEQNDKDREAQEIAARAMAQAEDRIQDNVARLFAENQGK